MIGPRLHLAQSIDEGNLEAIQEHFTVLVGETLALEGKTLEDIS
mgnify:CR=1 FL=1